jgi:hypothetical protein
VRWIFLKEFGGTFSRSSLELFLGVRWKLLKVFGENKIKEFVRTFSRMSMKFSQGFSLELFQGVRWNYSLELVGNFSRLSAKQKSRSSLVFFEDLGEVFPWSVEKVPTISSKGSQRTPRKSFNKLLEKVPPKSSEKFQRTAWEIRGSR